MTVKEVLSKLNPFSPYSGKPSVNYAAALPVVTLTADADLSEETAAALVQMAILAHSMMTAEGKS